MKSEDNWTCVYKTKKKHKAIICQGILEENEIKCVIVDKQDSSYLIGEAEVYVENNSVEKALEIIRNLEL